MIDLADGRLTAAAAGTLMGIGRGQVFRLRRAFEVSGASRLTSRKRGRASNRKQWMMADGLWIDRRHRLPSPTNPAGGGSALANWCRSTGRSMRGLRTAARRARCSWVSLTSGVSVSLQISHLV